MPPYNFMARAALARLPGAALPGSIVGHPGAVEREEGFIALR